MMSNAMPVNRRIGRIMMMMMSAYERGGGDQNDDIYDELTYSYRTWLNTTCGDKINSNSAMLRYVCRIPIFILFFFVFVSAMLNG